MNYYFEPDEPLTADEEDALGTTAIAPNLAAAIVAHRPTKGFVLGIEARWGAGKSTIIRAVERELRGSTTPPLVVWFSPWLVENKEALLTELVRSFIRAVEEATPRGHLVSDVVDHFRRRHLITLLRKLVRYAEVAQSLGKSEVAALDSFLELPIVREAVSVLRFVGAIFAPLLSKTETLADLKARAEKEILTLKRQFVVFVDDIDRLEISESREIFRLLKSVADFPFVTYVAAYDRAALISNGASSAADAQHYIDKIVQVPISLPEVDRVGLRKYLLRRLFEGTGGHKAILTRELGSTRQGAAATESSRLAEGLPSLIRAYLNTPRRIKVICNSLRVTWPNVETETDFGDYLILQSVREFDPAMSAWVSAYVSAYERHVLSRISQAHMAQLRDRLEGLLARAAYDRQDLLTILGILLPPLRTYT